MTALRFEVMVLADAPFDELARRWRTVEELGFDALWVADHSGDYTGPGKPWIEGMTVLAAMALQTRTIRIGPLVANPILRPPQLLAREAHALDLLSNGRLELGMGTGIADFDHRAMGVPAWSPKERAARFAEYVEIVDGLLRAEAGFEFSGRFHTASSPALTPPTPQRPRPPITVGGQSPTVRRVAAERADCWNTHGPFRASFEEIVEVTARQNAELDERAAAAGRRPQDIRRSLLLFRALDPWESGLELERVVAEFTAAGVREFILYWPPAGRECELERLAADVLPRLRAG